MQHYNTSKINNRGSPAHLSPTKPAPFIPQSSTPIRAQTRQAPSSLHTYLYHAEMILVVRLFTGGGDEWAACGRSVAEPGFSNKETKIQGGSNMTRTDLCVRLYKSVPVIFEPPCTNNASTIVGATTRQVTWHPPFVKPSNNIHFPVFNTYHYLHKVHDSDKIRKSNHNTVENYTIYSHY